MKDGELRKFFIKSKDTIDEYQMPPDNIPYLIILELNYSLWSDSQDDWFLAFAFVLASIHYIYLMLIDSVPCLIMMQLC